MDVRRRRPSRCPGWPGPLTLALAALLLSTCGSRAPQLQPPTLRIVELQLRPDQTIQIQLRVRNPVAATLPARGMDFSLWLEERELGRFSPPFRLDVPALGNELIEFEARSRPEIGQLLAQLEAGERARVEYRIEGELTHGDGKSTLPLDSRGWLSPTPGKPGSFR